MRLFKYFLLLLILAPTSNYAQSKIVILHPILGDTIDLLEKQTYLLFPEVEDSNFEYGQVVMKGNGFFFRSYSGGALQKIDLKPSALKQYHINIEKLIAYQDFLENQKVLSGKPLVVVNNKDTCALEMDIEYLSPKMRKRLKVNTKRYLSKKTMAEEMEHWVRDKSTYVYSVGQIEVIQTK